MNEKVNGVSGQNSALYGYAGPGKTWTNEMNFGTSHAPGAGPITTRKGMNGKN